MIVISSWSRLCPILWNQVLSREWRCSWSSANRRCSNYNWVIDNLIAYYGATYIRDLTVMSLQIRRDKSHIIHISRKTRYVLLSICNKTAVDRRIYLSLSCDCVEGSRQKSFLHTIFAPMSSWEFEEIAYCSEPLIWLCAVIQYFTYVHLNIHYRSNASIL